jgi:hypothetical protein
MKYLETYEKESKPRTKVWGVNTKHGDEFGEVKWYAPWRQYCYEIDGVVFTKTCLKDLYDFLEKVKDVRV